MLQACNTCKQVLKTLNKLRNTLDYCLTDVRSIKQITALIYTTRFVINIQTLITFEYQDKKTCKLLSLVSTIM